MQLDDHSKGDKAFAAMIILQTHSTSQLIAVGNIDPLMKDDWEEMKEIILLRTLGEYLGDR